MEYGFYKFFKTNYIVILNILFVDITDLLKSKDYYL